MEEKGKMASIYKNANATLAEEVRLRKHFKECIDEGLVNSIHNEKPYAIAYGVSDPDGTRKLFRKSPIFYTSEAFDRYVKKHRQIVLAIYSHK